MRIGTLIKVLIITWLVTKLVYGQQTKIDLQRQVNGTLQINHGGTGATTASGARSALSAVGVTDTQTLTNKTLTNPNITISGCTNNYFVYMVNSSTGQLGCLTIPGGAPSTSKYIIQTADGGLPNAQALSSLSTGLVKVTTTTGVLSTASAGDLPAHASSHQPGGGDPVATATPAASSIVASDGSGKIAAGWLPQTGVTPATYGSTGSIPSLTIAADGRISSASVVTPSLDASTIATGTLAAARVLTGSVTNNRCVHINGSGQIVAASTDCVAGTGNVTSSSSNTTGYVPTWTSTSGFDLSAGYAVSTGTIYAPNTLVQRDGGGSIWAQTFQAGAYVFTKANNDSAVPLQIVGFSLTQTGHLTSWTNAIGIEQSFISADGSSYHGAVVGNASTATSLAGAPSQCSAGTLIHGGIDTSGNAQGCAKVALGSEVSGNLPVANLNSGTGASNTTCWFGDGTWKTCSSGGSGTVTSVGLTGTAEMTISGSPVTTSGTLGIAWANQSQNTVFAGLSAGTGTPAFRALVANDIPSLDATKIGSGTLTLARGGTGQNGWTSNRCVRTDAGGTFLTSAAGDCVSTSGGTNTYIPQYTSSTNFSTGLPLATTTPTANAILGTDSLKGFKAYDKGGTVYNVQAYGAVGDGSNDDTVYIQNAMAACETSGNGGIVYFPNPKYKFSSQLHFGNGTAKVQGVTIGTINTLAPCRLKGNGTGLQAAPRPSTNGTTLIWAGSSTSTPVIDIRGPYIGGGLENLFIDISAGASPGIILHQTQQFRIQDVGFWGVGNGPAIWFKPTTDLDSAGGPNGANNGCRNSLNNVHINGYGTGGEGILMDETVGTTTVNSDECSNDINMIVAYGTTYGLKIIGADNNHFSRIELHGSGSGNCSLTFVQSLQNGAFPHENYFEQISPTDGVCGTVGTGQPNTFMAYGYGDCSTNCDVYANITTGTKPVVLSGTTVPAGGSFIKGINYYQSEISANNTIDQVVWRGDVGTSNIFLASRGASSNGLKFDFPFGGTIKNSSWGFQAVPVVVASLPGCTTALEGTMYAVTNSSVTTFLSTVAGGGTNHVPVYCNGTNWVVH